MKNKTILTAGVTFAFSAMFLLSMTTDESVQVQPAAGPRIGGGGGGHISIPHGGGGGGGGHFSAPHMQAPARAAQRAPTPARNFSTVPHISRTPSMSRSVRSPQQEQFQRLATQRRTTPFPAFGKPGGQRNQLQQNNLQARQQVQGFLRQRTPITPPAKANLSPSFQAGQQVTPSITQNQHLLSQQSDRARSIIGRRFPNRAGWFGDDFYRRHNYYPYYYSQGANWWWAPSWQGVTSWLPYGWTDPYYYADDGDAYTVPPSTYEIPPDQYVPPQTEDDWLPLGVFAAGQSAQDTPYTTMFVQLALDKNGNLAGTYYNTATDETHELDGQVDPTTQEAAWKVSDNPNSPTMTTGLYNLTQDAAVVQVHFPDGSIQPWMYARLTK